MAVKRVGVQQNLKDKAGENAGRAIVASLPPGVSSLDQKVCRFSCRTSGVRETWWTWAMRAAEVVPTDACGDYRVLPCHSPKFGGDPCFQGDIAKKT